MKRSSDWWYKRQVGTGKQARIEPEYRVLAGPPGSVCPALAAVHSHLDKFPLDRHCRYFQSVSKTRHVASLSHVSHGSTAASIDMVCYRNDAAQPCSPSAPGLCATSIIP